MDESRIQNLHIYPNKIYINAVFIFEKQKIKNQKKMKVIMNYSLACNKLKI